MLLVAHGSRDPRAAGVVAALADAVRSELGGGRTGRTGHRVGQRVAVAHLDFTEPSVGAALRELSAGGASEVVVVPLLFAPGYHLRVDLPAAVAEVRAGRPDLVVSIDEPLGAEPSMGEPDLLLDALTARLPEPPSRYDALVLASAGSSEPLSRQAVDAVASRWSLRLGRPVASAFATGAGPRVDVAVARLRAQGAERVAVSGLFLASGRLPEAVRRTAIEVGASVAEPLGAEPQLARLVARRANRVQAHALLTP